MVPMTLIWWIYHFWARFWPYFNFAFCSCFLIYSPKFMDDPSRPKFVVVHDMGIIRHYGFHWELMGIIKKKTFLLVAAGDLVTFSRMKEHFSSAYPVQVRFPSWFVSSWFWTFLLQLVLSWFFVFILNIMLAIIMLWTKTSYIVTTWIPNNPSTFAEQPVHPWDSKSSHGKALQQGRPLFLWPKAGRRAGER